MSRTPVAGMAQYYRRQLQALADAGMPVPDALFDELTRVAIRLKLDPPQPMVAIAINPITGATDRKEPELRRGFEELRDILTRYRRAWTETHIASYLRQRWDGELRQAARLYNQALSERGKPPTLKQLSASAITPTSHWFRGDVSRLYRAMGEKCPVRPPIRP